MRQHLTLLLVLVLLTTNAACYRATMIPPTTIHVTDENGKPIAGFTGMWKSSTNEAFHEEQFIFDKNAHAQVGPYYADGNVLKLSGKFLLGAVFVHADGLQTPIVEFNIVASPGYKLDRVGSHLTPVVTTVVSNPPMWRLPNGCTLTEGVSKDTPVFTYDQSGVAKITSTAESEGIWIETWDAAKADSLDFQFVFRKQSVAK